MQIHLIIGEDDYLVEEAARKIVGDGVGLETIDSTNAGNAGLQLADLRAVDESVSTPPFLDPRKVTWWRNVAFLPGASKSALAEDVKVVLERFAARLAATALPENQHFVLTAPRLLKTSVFAKTLAGAAEVITFDAGKPWEQARRAEARVTELAAGMNLAFERGAAQAFVTRVGTDSRSLASELAKMRDYLGPNEHTVTCAAVATVTSAGIGSEPTPWALTDALGARDVGKVCDEARRLAGENGFAIVVTNAVERFFRQMAELKDAADHNRFDEAAESLAPFTARKMSGFLRNWTLRELRIARFRFLTLRERVVSSSGESDVLVLTELVRAARKAVRT